MDSFHGINQEKIYLISNRVLYFLQVLRLIQSNLVNDRYSVEVAIVINTNLNLTDSALFSQISVLLENQ
jgi:hypothetical protein